MSCLVVWLLCDGYEVATNHHPPGTLMAHATYRSILPRGQIRRHIHIESACDAKTARQSGLARMVSSSCIPEQGLALLVSVLAEPACRYRQIQRSQVHICPRICPCFYQCLSTHGDGALPETCILSSVTTYRACMYDSIQFNELFSGDAAISEISRPVFVSLRRML